MESQPSTPNTGASAHLAGLRRAEVLAHTRYPKLGAWYPPTFGAMAAVFVAAYALPIWAAIPVWLLLAAGGGAAARVYLERRGTMPDPTQAPRPLKREMTYFLVGYGLAIVAIVAVWLTAPWWAASLVAFASFTIGLTVYERRYASAAHQAEIEAGISS